jgi:hypothetical protein
MSRDASGADKTSSKDGRVGSAVGVPSSGAVSTSSGGGGGEKEPDVIVLDIGTGSIKAGWAGEDAPRVVIPTLLLDHHGQAMPASVMDQHHMERNEYAVGHAALQVSLCKRPARRSTAFFDLG